VVSTTSHLFSEKADSITESGDRQRYKARCEIVPTPFQKTNCRLNSRVFGSYLPFKLLEQHLDPGRTCNIARPCGTEASGANSR
jgi:hypothetical protein